MTDRMPDPAGWNRIQELEQRIDLAYRRIGILYMAMPESSPYSLDLRLALDELKG